MNRKLLRFILLTLSITMLSACTRSVPISKDSALTLPPIENKFIPSQIDGVKEYAETVLLYLPGISNNQLTSIPERILIPADQHPAEATIRKLLSFSGNDAAKALFPDANLKLKSSTGSLEISGDVATVNLSANALLLSKSDLFLVRRALTNTLLQWRDIRFVNVLVTDIEPGIGQNGLSPTGSMQTIRNEDSQAVWDGLTNRTRDENFEQFRFSSLCTLYFPASFGRGILNEARMVSFPGHTHKQLVISLLEALSAGPQILLQAPVMPDLNALLSEPVIIEENDDGTFIINLQFLNIANETFINAGIPRSIMMAALTFTMCTFIPQVQGIKIKIGNEQIEGIVPAAIYKRAGEQILFTGNILKRENFSSFLLSDCTLYFADRTDNLHLTRRPIPFQLAFDRQYILEQLILGPQVFDSVTGLLPVFSPEISQADLIAIDKEGSTAFVNFSQQLIYRSKNMSPQQERLMVYGIVNTLCDTRSTKKVRIFIEGQQPLSIAGSIYLPGEFIKNPEIVR